MEDEKIVDLYLQRDESAIRYTSEKYGKRLLYIANNILNDLSVSEECENDTYMEAWKAIPPYEPRTYLFAFLARITRHKALDICRKQSRSKRNVILVELTEELEQCIPSPNDTECQMEFTILGEMISKFLRQLPEEHRNVFVCRYWYMDSVANISKKFLFSESKVKIILYRTRNRLRDYLKEEGVLL